MSKTITIDVFNPASIDAAVREIREYSKWVRRKTDELRERIAYFIAKDASAVFNTAVAEDDMREGVITGSVEVSVESQGDNTTVIIASGKDAVFMEFGAGVYYNGAVGSSPNPLGTALGFTIGSYGKGNGRKEVWAYDGGDGQIHLTHGTPASMPLYRAVQSVSRDIVRIAREVFASG
jgi:hypothetical protein